MTTITASQFKATCLDIFDRVAAGELDRVVITKRGRVVGVLHPPEATASAPEDVFGCMRDSVLIPAGFDLTAPAESDLFDAATGALHR